ncbi:hypothetical protein K4K52_012355 [Colletotrichum sp. SAR 10_76]|nr:hypothetical protein K4K52_012355 [Colletotrichum sp. SAR 10_76]
MNHPRTEIKRHSITIHNSHADVASGASDDDRLNEKLKPGQEQIFSYWVPGLKAGRQHHIRVTQTIDGHKPEDKPLQLESTKAFFVEAPQFSLPGDAIHSVYPPQGYRDDARILPHVVLTDPHLPWERTGSAKTDSDDEKVGGRPRTKVPWLILCSFTQEELALPAGDLNGTNSIFAGTSTALVKPVQQSNTMTLSMNIADLLATSKTRTPITKNTVSGSVEKTRGDFIFLKKEMFLNLFCNFDDNGTRQNPPVINTVPYGLLAHVRHVNASGMALAGVEDSVVFSLVIGNRAGPLNITTPATVSVHLLSIEGVEAMSLPFASTTEYVAMCSLHSWNYTVNPPGMVNVYEAFTSLGKTLSVLRPPEQVVKPLLPAEENDPNKTRSKEQLRVGARMNDGYSIVKHRLQTGEDTVAFFRGPFTPTVVDQTAPIWDRCSNSGQDLQILDPILGIMDITYSSAWQLGRVLALGDEGFVTALGRLRTAIHKPAMKEAKIAAIRAINPTAYRGKQDLLSDLPSLVQGLADIQNLSKKPLHITSSSPNPDGDGDGGGDEGGSNADTDSQTVDATQFEAGGIKKRWYRRRLSRREIPDLSFSSPRIQSRYPGAAEKFAEKLSASTDGSVYDETNVPVSTDWMVVMTWLLGKMFLDGVPAHYLITDPSHLPEESLRFFYIDPNWVEALLDGALSLGNHRGRDEDRVAIKKAFNGHITSTPEHTDFTPQIPTYGFFLRSDLVSMYPDLRVTTLPPPEDLPPGYKDRAPLLRHTIIADGVMFGLLDRAPSSEIFNGLVFSQPPHQQRFAVGDSLDDKHLTINIRRQYTTPSAGQAPDKARHHTLPPTIVNEPIRAGSRKNNLFTWGSEIGRHDLRIMRIPQYAAQQLTTLQGLWPKDWEKPDGPSGGELSPNGNRYFQDNAVSSALFAMQLSDPNYTLTVNFKGDTTAGARLTSLLPPRPPGDGGASSTDPAALSMSNAPLAVTNTSSSLRTLNSLKAPIVQRLLASADSHSAAAVEEDDKDDDERSDKESSKDDDPFSHPPNYAAPISRSSGHGPHVPRIPEVVAAPETPTEEDDDENTPELNTPSSSSGGAAQPSFIVTLATTTTPPGGMPSFDISIYTRGVNTNVIEIPRDPNQQLAQDLIFSIQAKDNANGDAWKLMELNLTIPFGRPASAATAATAPAMSDYFLMSQYTGPGATMLSNLRFNILAALVTKNGRPALQLRLLPRAKDGFIPINRVENISFLLALADINRWDGKTPKIAQPVAMQPAPTAEEGAAAGGSPPTQFKQLHFEDGVKAQYHPRTVSNPPRTQALDISVFYAK